jgi:hypothetical protein
LFVAKDNILPYKRLLDLRDDLKHFTKLKEDPLIGDDNLNEFDLNREREILKSIKKIKSILRILRFNGHSRKEKQLAGIPFGRKKFYHGIPNYFVWKGKTAFFAEIKDWESWLNSNQKAWLNNFHRFFDVRIIIPAPVLNLKGIPSINLKQVPAIKTKHFLLTKKTYDKFRLFGKHGEDDETILGNMFIKIENLIKGINILMEDNKLMKKELKKIRKQRETKARLF